MSCIWAVRIVPGESILMPTEVAIQLSHATLLHKPKSGRTVLQVVVNNVEYALCVLQKDVIETQRLTHGFLPNDRAMLKVTGTNTVQIIGNIIKLQQPESDDSDVEDEDEFQKRLELYASMRPKCKSSSYVEEKDEEEKEEEKEEEEKPVKKRRVHFELLSETSDDDTEEDEDYVEKSEDEDNSDDSNEEEEDDSNEEEEDDENRETITGEPRYANYISDLLGPDLPDEEDDDYQFEQMADDYGTLAFRDPTDNDLLGGFELRHFNLVPNYPGFEKVDLREQEKTKEDTLLHDNIARGLVNALLNSGDEMQMSKGRELHKKLKKQCRNRKTRK